MKTELGKQHETPDTHTHTKPSPYLQGPVQEQVVDRRPEGEMSQEVWGYWCLQQWLWTCPARSRTSDACDEKKGLKMRKKKKKPCRFVNFKISEVWDSTFGNLSICSDGTHLEIADNLLVHIPIWSDHEGNTSAIQSFWHAVCHL